MELKKKQTKKKEEKADTPAMEPCKRPMGEFVMNAMALFGAEVNNNRQFPGIYDGLKTVYRRVLYTMMKEGINSMTKTAKLGGAVLALHPHGDASVNPVISAVVRANIADGQGDHGMAAIVGDNFEPAAPRYTEAKLSKKFYEIFHDFMPYVPMVEGEMTDPEPKYLPTPIPLCLTMPMALGIGFGARCNTPAFTVESMYNALMKDDPKELRAPFGLKLDMDKSEIEKLWYKGEGILYYKYNVNECDEEGNKGFVISAENAEFVKPDLKKIEKACENGLVWKNDITDKDGVALMVCRCKGVKNFSDEDLKAMCEEAAICKFSATLAVSNGNQAFIVPLRNWLQITYTNYLNLIERFKADKIDKLEFQYKVYDALIAVASLILKNRSITEDEICKKLKLELNVVQAIVAKQIKVLSSANGDEVEAKKKEILNSIEYYKAMVPKLKVREMFGKFTSGKLIKEVDIKVKIDDDKLMDFEKKTVVPQQKIVQKNNAQVLEPKLRDINLAKAEIKEMKSDGNVFSKAVNIVFEKETIDTATRKALIFVLESAFNEAKLKDKSISKFNFIKENAIKLLVGRQ